ncbi:MBL fold metallo-hydrolase [Pleionea litopenaei]|uniref:MBL fold metallo-hydrolase n=1 Tax=Pleionea litopenaei TaxID=3070815 RepID=A0AA51X7W1_9GAMM|nr:MBL fold metallo-hydrolase [Pleionea sp. HL-JVS1]WMS88314.1 MBL fold metallo-hydrolase [Pleionea sp. HL-JVS1]
MKTLALSCLLTLSFTSTLLVADNHEQSVKFSVQEVSPGVYMLMGVGGFTGGNIGLSIGNDGVVMIDDAMPSSLDIMQDAIKSVTKEPIDFLINTHVHGDHTGNNVVMSKQGARIVAHENLREHLKKKGIKNGDKMEKAPEAMLPVITFSTSMSFHLNGQDARLTHLPHAHTDGDAVIHFEQANVIHTGDVLFNGLFPFIDVNSGGSAKGYLNAQKALLKLADKNTKIIPGHGPLATRADLERSVAMLEDSIKIISALIQQGKTEEQVVTLNPLQKYHNDWNWGFITTERMTRQLFQSLSSSQQHTAHADAHTQKDHNNKGHHH